MLLIEKLEVAQPKGDPLSGIPNMWNKKVSCATVGLSWDYEVQDVWRHEKFLLCNVGHH